MVDWPHDLFFRSRSTIQGFTFAAGGVPGGDLRPFHFDCDDNVLPADSDGNRSWLSNRFRSRNGSRKGVTYESTDSFVVAYPALALDAIGVFTATRRIVGEADGSQSALDNIPLRRSASSSDTENRTGRQSGLFHAG